MNWEGHCISSRVTFDECAAEVHKWFDQYATDPFNHDHRKVLHHREGVEVGVQLFGEWARKHLIQHLLDDYGLDDVKEIPSILQLREEELR